MKLALHARLRRLAATSLVVACASLPAWAGSPALLDAHDLALRDDLAWLADRGVLQLSLGTWPTTVSLVEDAIAQCDCNSLYPEDLEALAHVRRALDRARARSVRLAMRVNSARHPAVDAATERGSAEVSLAGQVSSDDWAARLQLNAIAEPLATSNEHGSLDGSYVAVNGPGFVATLGAVGRWWGPGQYTGVVLTNAAPAVPALLLRRSEETPFESSWLSWIGPWTWEVSAGQPRHYVPPRTKSLTMRLAARPLPGLELGASRYIYWGGEGQPETGSALLRALLGNSNIDDHTRHADPSNELAGFDLRWVPPVLLGPNMGVYAQWVGEDESNTRPSHLITAVGLQVKQPVNGHRFELTFEGTDTVTGRLLVVYSGEELAQAYVHGTYLSGHYHQGLPVGAHIGGGGRAVSAGLNWVPPDDGNALRLHARLWKASLGDLGPEPLNTIYGYSGKLFGALLRAQGERASGLRWYAALSLQRYPAGPRRNLGVQAGVELPLYVAD